MPVPFTWQYPKTAIGRRIGLAIPGGCSSDFTGVAFPSGNADIEAAFATAGEHRIEACSSVTGRSSRSGISRRRLGGAGLERPDAKALPSRPELQTIAAALRDARNATMRFDKKSSTWGAYQHYGKVGDRLLAPSGDDLLPLSVIGRLNSFIERI